MPPLPRLVSEALWEVTACSLETTLLPFLDFSSVDSYGAQTGKGHCTPKPSSVYRLPQSDQGASITIGLFH